MSDTLKTDMAARKIGAAAARWKNDTITAIAFADALDRFADTVAELERENAALREQNENLASLLFRVLRKLDKNDPLRIHCLDYLKKIGRTLNPFRAALDAVSKEEQP